MQSWKHHKKDQEPKQMQLRIVELQNIMKPMGEQAKDLQAKAETAKEDYNAALRQADGKSTCQDVQKKQGDPQHTKTIEDLFG